MKMITKIDKKNQIRHFILSFFGSARNPPNELVVLLFHWATQHTQQQKQRPATQNSNPKNIPIQLTAKMDTAHIKYWKK